MEMETEGAMLEFMIDWWVRCKGANIWLLYIHHSTHFNHWNTVLYQPKTGSQSNECATFFFSSPFFYFLLFFTLYEYQRDYHEASSFWTLLKCRNLHESTGMISTKSSLNFCFFVPPNATEVKHCHVALKLDDYFNSSI